MTVAYHCRRSTGAYTMEVKSRGHWFAVFWRRIAPTNARRAVTLCVVLAALLALAVYRAREPVTSPVARTIEGAVTDPVAQFAETRTGHVLIPSESSGLCRRVLFENRTGALLEAGEVSCRQAEAGLGTSGGSTDRLMAVRNAFHR